MKILCFLMFTTACFAQEVDSLYVTPQGINGYLVLNTEGNANDLHNKAEEWIKYNFTNPDEVIQSSIKGKLLRCQMYYPLGVEFYQGDQLVGADLKQVLELRFQDGKIKYTILEFDCIVGGVPMVLSGGAFTPSFYNNKGELRGRAEACFNGLIQKLNVIPQDLIGYVEASETEDDW